MTKTIYIGIYGTAHDTQARAEDDNGNLIGSGRTDVANIHFSIKHAWENIVNAAKQSIEPIDLNKEKHNVYAGISIKNTELVEACQDLLDLNKFFDKTELSSDAYALCLGVNHKTTAVIIADEGLVGNVVINKKIIKIGGWGFPHADIGSVPWIGLEALHLTLQWIDGYIEKSPLLEAIYQHFNNDTANLVKWAMESRAKPQNYENIAKIVFDYVEANDHNALKLIQKSADEIEKIYIQLCKKSNNSNLPLVLFGPLKKILLPFLSNEITKNIIEPSGNGLDGALKLIREKLSNESN